MSNLNEFLNDDNSPSQSPLKPVRIGEEPAMVLPFTGETEDVGLHFEGDPAVNKYVVCPGPRCPHCYMGAAPAKFSLLPVYNVESGNVEVLQVSKKRGPNELGPTLARLLAAGDVDTKLVVISRLKNKQLVINVEPLAENADHGEKAIQAFLEAMKAGLLLRSAYWCPTAAELAAVDRVKRKLDAKGGYEVKDAT